MLSTQFSISPQKFKIHGFKFFDGSLHRLKAELEATDPAPILSSSIAIFIGLHAICDDNGLLPQDFKVSDIASKLQLPYSTAVTGFNDLVNRMMVKELLIGEKGSELPVYELCGYSSLNRTMNEVPDNHYVNGFSYFRVPFEIFNTTVLSSLVSQRDRNGLLSLLDFCNGMTRELRWKKDSLSSYKLERTMKFLKKKLNRSATKVRRFMETIQPLFNIDFNFETRKPNESRLNRVRKAVTQLWVRKFEIRLTDNCVVENDDLNGVRQLEAKMRKEAYDRMKNLGVALNKRQQDGIAFAFKEEILSIAKWIEDKKLQQDLITNSMQDALDNFESYIRLGKRVNNAGAFIRAKLRESWNYWKQTNLDVSSRHDIIVSYMNENGEAPAFLA